MRGGNRQLEGTHSKVKHEARGRADGYTHAADTTVTQVSNCGPGPHRIGINEYVTAQQFALSPLVPAETTREASASLF